MNEFYIHERFMVNNVEAIRIVPLNARQIEMIKKPWGVLINGDTYCGHVELRTFLGNIVDSYSGKYADANVRQDFSLNLPDYELFGIYSVDYDSNFVYVQYTHIETGVPMLIRYASIDESPVSILENQDDRWGEDRLFRCSYFRTYNCIHVDYYQDEQIPRMRGSYIEIDRVEGAVYLPICHTLPVDVVFDDKGIGLQYRLVNHKVVNRLNSSIVSHRSVLINGTVQDVYEWDANSAEYHDKLTRKLWIEHNARDPEQATAYIFHGVKSITKSD